MSFFFFFINLFALPLLLSLGTSGSIFTLKSGFCIHWWDSPVSSPGWIQTLDHLSGPLLECFLVHLYLSCTGVPRPGQSAPYVASPGQNRGEESPRCTCWGYSSQCSPACHQLPLLICCPPGSWGCFLLSLCGLQHVLVPCDVPQVLIFLFVGLSEVPLCPFLQIF